MSVDSPAAASSSRRSRARSQACGIGPGHSLRAGREPATGRPRLREGPATSAASSCRVCDDRRNRVTVRRRSEPTQTTEESSGRRSRADRSSTAPRRSPVTGAVAVVPIPSTTRVNPSSGTRAAASSIASGSPSRRRHSAAASARSIAVGASDSSSPCARRSKSSATASVTPASGSSSVSGVRQRLELHDDLVSNVERMTTRGQERATWARPDASPGSRRQRRARRCSASSRTMSPSSTADNVGECREPALVRAAERLSDATRHEPVVGQRAEFHKDRSVGKLVGHFERRPRPPGATSPSRPARQA